MSASKTTCRIVVNIRVCPPQKEDVFYTELLILAFTKPLHLPMNKTVVAGLIVAVLAGMLAFLHVSPGISPVWKTVATAAILAGGLTVLASYHFAARKERLARIGYMVSLGLLGLIVGEFTMSGYRIAVKTQGTYSTQSEEGKPQTASGSASGNLIVGTKASLVQQLALLVFGGWLLHACFRFLSFIDSHEQDVSRPTTSPAGTVVGLAIIVFYSLAAIVSWTN